MKMRWAILLLLPLIGGCAAEPFVREPLPVLRHPDAKSPALRLRANRGRSVYLG